MKWIIFDDSLIAPADSDVFTVTLNEEDDYFILRWHKSVSDAISITTREELCEYFHTEKEAVSRLEEICHLLNRPYG